LPGVVHATVPSVVLFVPDVGLFDAMGVTLSVVAAVLDVPASGPVCVVSEAVTEVFVVPLISPAAAVTFRDAVVLAPGAKVTGEREETVNVVLSEFVTDRLKVEDAAHTAVSLFVMLTVYAAVPPSAVIVWAVGVMLTVGAFTTQTGTLIVVVTLLEVTFAWFPLAAVTEEVFVPLIWPAFAFTVRVTVLLVAPGASITEAALRVEALKAVVLLSLFVRLNVSFAQLPVSLFVMVRVYTMVPLSVVIVPDNGVMLTVGTLRTQAGTFSVVATVLDATSAWPAPCAVTEVFVVPVVLVLTAVTFTGTVVLAPGAKVTGERAGTVKTVLFEFVTGRVKVTSAHPPASLFVMLSV